MDKKVILIVDDEENVRYSFRKLFRNASTEVIEATNGLEAISIVKKAKPDLILMDIEMPGMSGLDAIQHIRLLQPEIPVIIATAFGTTERVIGAMKYGAFEYLEKPFEINRLREVVQEALATNSLVKAQTSPKETPKTESTDAIVGVSPAIKEVYKMIGRVAASDVSVLISGESGTGKELVANAIHKYSDRSYKPFVAINCAAIPDNLLESELFGYEKGAFTDASQSRPGKFEQAQGGTIFLDEIADMSIHLQAKLLRILQEGTFERLGSNKNLTADVRVISATNKNLENAIQQGQFREDLYYRLKVITITIPPLRMRKEDIPALTNHFVTRLAREFKKGNIILPEESMDLLVKYNWPGNVRELENALKKAVLLCRANIITPELIQNEMNLIATTYPTSDKVSTGLIPQNLEEFDGHLYKHVIEQAEKELITKALAHCKGNNARTSRLLGISRAMLYERMEKFDIQNAEKES
jgi:nitrogen regulation protein NR(I)